MMISNHVSLCYSFSFCFQSFPAPRSFSIIQLFTSGGQSIRASASAAIFPMNIQDWFPLELTGLIFCSQRTLDSLLQYHNLKPSIPPFFSSFTQTVNNISISPVIPVISIILLCHLENESKRLTWRLTKNHVSVEHSEWYQAFRYYTQAIILTSTGIAGKYFSNSFL